MESESRKILSIHNYCWNLSTILKFYTEHDDRRALCKISKLLDSWVYGVVSHALTCLPAPDAIQRYRDAVCCHPPTTHCKKPEVTWLNGINGMCKRIQSISKISDIFALVLCQQVHSKTSQWRHNTRNLLTLRPDQNDRHSTDDIFRCILLD